MSTVAEIEAAIRELAPEEFEELVSWIDARRTRTISDEDFQKASDTVFTHYAPLLEELSK